MGFYFEKIWTKNSMTFFCFKKKKDMLKTVLVGKNYFESKRFLKEKKHMDFTFKRNFGFQKSQDFEIKEYSF